jgi:hypothetical protein
MTDWFLRLHIPCSRTQTSRSLFSFFLSGGGPHAHCTRSLTRTPAAAQPSSHNHSQPPILSRRFTPSPTTILAASRLMNSPGGGKQATQRDQQQSATSAVIEAEGASEAALSTVAPQRQSHADDAQLLSRGSLSHECPTRGPLPCATFESLAAVELQLAPQCPDTHSRLVARRCSRRLTAARGQPALRVATRVSADRDRQWTRGRSPRLAAAVAGPAVAAPGRRRRLGSRRAHRAAAALGGRSRAARAPRRCAAPCGL